MSILSKNCVLKLNSYWVPLRPETPEKIFIDMAKDTVRALNIEYPVLENGSIDFDNSPSKVEAVTWEEWVALPVREYDSFVSTSKQKIRIPTVVVCTVYGKVPMKKPRLSPQNIYKRDNGTCQYTGKKLSHGEWNIDHIIPRDKGGKSTWENMVVCDRKVNSAKGNKFNHEVGLNLIRKPKAPSLVSACATINEATHRDWKHFLMK
jgi:5-methylcytosine-specific restriction endonuclease McrA